MMREKSCGAVIYRETPQGIEYLLILNKKAEAKGHWGFAKGHIEPGETEVQTAKREIKEETGIDAQIDTGFRAVSHYVPMPGVEKDAVYFAAKVNDDTIKIQESEIGDYLWCDFETAKEKLTYEADKTILRAAQKYFNEK